MDTSIDDPDGEDDLVEAARHERVELVAARRRLRAWLLSAGASAGTILLGVAVATLMRATPPSSDHNPPGFSIPTPVIVWNDNDHAWLSAFQVLADVRLPPGWVRGAMTQMIELIAARRAGR